MTSVRLRPGFTLLEMLLATVILGLLMSLLTTLFNQGNNAWAVGRASVADLDARRRTLAEASRRAADFIPAGTEGYRVLSAWDANGGLRTTRPLEPAAGLKVEEGAAYLSVTLDPGETKRASVVGVCVTSAGPDGVWGTEDDLSTVPEEAIE